MGMWYLKIYDGREHMAQKQDYFFIVSRHEVYFPLLGLRYCTYSGDGIAIITIVPRSVTELTQNHKGYDVPCQTSSCLENLKCAS